MRKLTAVAIILVLLVSGGAVVGETADEAVGDEKDAQIAQRDALIGAQEELLNAYRCLLSLDLELVEQGCPDVPPQFVPAGWDTFGFSNGYGSLGLVTRGWYLPPTPNGSTLSLRCERGRISPRISFHGFEMSVIRGMIEVSYTVGGTTRTDNWKGNLFNTQLTVIPSSPAQTEAFLDDLATIDEDGLLVTVADADGVPITTKFNAQWGDWAVNVIRNVCN